MKYFLICLIVFSFLFGQNYTISVFGAPLVSVTLERGVEELTFQTETTGILNYIWPVDNTYFITYDSSNYGFRQYEKTIHQGSESYSLKAYYDHEKKQVLYDNISLDRPPDVQTIFSMLIRVQEENIEEIDTKWFLMEHDSRLFESRYLWAETDTILINNNEMVCDLYRLDIKEVEGVTSLPEQSDYFMNNITEREAVRQIWVEKTIPGRIIKASVKLYGLNFIAKLTYD
ncbi:MAG: hypothetical protein ACE5D0_03665 [Fidelibacterota bacterium]